MSTMPAGLKFIALFYSVLFSFIVFFDLYTLVRYLGQGFGLGDFMLIAFCLHGIFVVMGRLLGGLSWARFLTIVYSLVGMYYGAIATIIPILDGFEWGILRDDAYMNIFFGIVFFLVFSWINIYLLKNRQVGVYFNRI